MNASPEHQRLLLDIAEIDRKLSRAEKARTNPAQGPRIKELAAQRQEQVRELTQLTGVLEDARAELTRLESDVALVEQRRDRDAQRLATTSSPKDAQALEHELASLAKRQSDLEDAELEVMARVEEAEAAVAAQQANIDQTTAEGTELTSAAKAAIAAATAEGNSCPGTGRRSSPRLRRISSRSTSAGRHAVSESAFCAAARAKAAR
ncbi:zinc ribbon domain-containing protein [Microbacterium sp. NIBRBAC000506063]|uniref:zinc ribbon domain-containing protein n=1 Tax=Microbacterium sp. NIBRBAC000506063 TaxID=2734618 RepID=UPI001CB722B4|nr:hypothetical protein [Microbacterium sp. NIBRBAC000506063]